MLAWQYNAVGVSDAITMGGEGKGLLNIPWHGGSTHPGIHIVGYLVLMR